MEFLLRILIICVSLIAVVNSQLGFDPDNPDSKFLDETELELSNQVVGSRVAVLKHMRSLELATSEYISVKLRDNVLKAVRELTGEELLTPLFGSRRSWKKSLRSGRQDDEQVPEGAEGSAEAVEGSVAESSGGDSGGEEVDEEPATTELTGLGTAVQINQNVFKFLGDTVKILASGLGGVKVARKSSDPFFVSAEALMKERFSDQLLGLVVLLANETEGLSEPSAGPGKTVRGSHPKLHTVLANSVKQSQPLEEQLNSRQDPKQLNSYYFVETFRLSVDDMLLKRVQQSHSVPDLYDGVHGSFELIRAMEALSSRLQRD